MKKSFPIDSVISATKFGNSLTAKTLGFLQQDDSLQKYFGHLSNYDGIFILGYDSHKIWCHETIVSLNVEVKVPVFLIEVEKFDKWSNSDLARYSLWNLQDQCVRVFQTLQ